jgi:hypothetical protein
MLTPMNNILLVDGLESTNRMGDNELNDFEKRTVMEDFLSRT